MAQDHSFDIVSKVNLQELRNALQQAQKEIGTRFDFRGSSAGVEFEEAPPVLKMSGDHAGQLTSVADVVQTRLAQRKIAVKAFVWENPEQLPSGHMKQQATLQQGLSAEKAKAVAAAVKALGLKVQPRIDGDSVRVSAKQIDDLQAVMKTLSAKDFGVPLQFENYR